MFSGGVSQARPTLHGTLMQRMTDVLSRMLNDPATRAALSHGGEDIYPETDENQSSQNENNTQGSVLHDLSCSTLTYSYENCWLR